MKAHEHKYIAGTIGDECDFCGLLKSTIESIEPQDPAIERVSTSHKEEWEEEFDEKFTDNGNGWSNVNIYRDAGKNLISELKSFISQAHQEAYEQGKKEGIDKGFVSRGVVEAQIKATMREELKKELVSRLPEAGIKWMQEGSHKDRKGFTDGFNSCLENITKIIEQS